MKKPTLEELQAVIKIKEILNDELQSKLKEKEEEIERLKLFEKLNENKRALMNNMEEDYKELEEQLTKSNEMNERLAEALFEVKFDNIQYGGITGVVKDKMNEALTEYQNSKK